MIENKEKEKCKFVMKLAWFSAFVYLSLAILYLVGSCNFPGCSILDSMSFIIFLDIFLVSCASVIILDYNLKRVANGWINRLKRATVFIIGLIIIFSAVQFLLLASAVQVNKYFTGIDLLNGDVHGTFFMFPIAVTGFFIGICMVFGTALLLMLPIESDSKREK